MPPQDERGTYLPTGWRVVGSEAGRVVEQAVARRDQLTPGPVRETLYAVRFTTDPVTAGRAAVERVLDAITDEVRRTWAECPRLLRDEPVDRPPSRFGGLRFDVLATPGREWQGEVLWRAVHPVVAGAAITTRVLIEERKSWTRVSVRVTADDGVPSVRGYVGAGQAQPAFLRALRAEIVPVWMGAPLEARPVRTGEVDELVHGVLASPSREVPVVVLAPFEEGGYVLDPDDLAWELLGRARLYVLQEHRQTFELTDTIGDRRMSAYWGAAHAYMPGWTRHDDPYDHPLLVADRLSDPVMRAVWLGELGIWTGTRLELPPPIAERLEPAPPAGSPADAVTTKPIVATVTPPAGDRRTADAGTTSPQRDGAAVERAPEAPQPAESAHAPLLELIMAELRKVGSAVAGLADEVERLRTISAVRSSSTSAIERRLGRLEELIEHAIAANGAAAEPEVAGAADEVREDDEQPSVATVVQDAAEAHADALVFLDDAFASAGASPYEDPERVRAILEAMARVARRRRDGLLGTSLREAFSDLGIDYRGAIARTTPARLREQYRFSYDGQSFEAEEHIALGNTYDPRRCLRVYFSSRIPNEPRFVIGHVGRHFEVQSTT